jgi:hypothetical protein
VLGCRHGGNGVFGVADGASIAPDSCRTVAQERKCACAEAISARIERTFGYLRRSEGGDANSTDNKGESRWRCLLQRSAPTACTVPPRVSPLFRRRFTQRGGTSRGRVLAACRGPFPTHGLRWQAFGHLLRAWLIADCPLDRRPTDGRGGAERLAGASVPVEVANPRGFAPLGTANAPIALGLCPRVLKHRRVSRLRREAAVGPASPPTDGGGFSLLRACIRRGRRSWAAVRTAQRLKLVANVLVVSALLATPTGRGWDMH